MKKRMLCFGVAGVVVLSAAYMLVETPSDRLASVQQVGDGKADIIQPVVIADLDRDSDGSDASDVTDVLSRDITAFEARQHFLDGLQSFLDAPDAVPEAERADTADRYRAMVRDHAARDEFSGAEALMLELALLRHQVAEEDYPDSAQALMDAYSDDSQAREATWRAESTHQLAAYKQREREIVDVVRAMDSFPDGMTQGQYLRERLQAERERLAAGE
ncbi:MAG: hypothetical protein LAT61_07020 [Alcanivorax sp.]|nr:hypothetical protein [Alcanivorax sp.]